MNNTGIRGRKLHEDIINIARFDLLPYLWSHGFQFAASIASENIMRSMFGPKKIPDSVLMSHVTLDGETTNNEMVIIEVGRFNPDKWGSSQTVVHIGFDGTVGIINGSFTDFERAACEGLKQMVNKAVSA